MGVVSRTRHELARRRWLARSAIVALVGATWWSAASWATSIDEQRATWGATATVWVAQSDVDAGELLGGQLEPVEHPVAVVPDAALRSVGDGAVARRAIPAGAVVTRLDVVAPGESLLDPTELAVAVVERVPSGVQVGDRVAVSADGIVITSDGTVLTVSDDRIVLAVAAESAPAVAAAVNGPNGVSLLIHP